MKLTVRDKAYASRIKVKKLRDEKALTFQQIGDTLGVSRQRAHQIYQEGKQEES